MVYLDYNATTPLDPRVLEAMMPYMGAGFGNPSSLYSLGRQARAAVEKAREQVAALVGAHPSQVIFTSGGTEANNCAIKGAVAHSAPAVVAVSAIEHASVSAPIKALVRRGWCSVEIGVDEQGRVSPDAVAEAVSRDCRLAAVMWANNETGVHCSRSVRSLKW